MVSSKDLVPLSWRASGGSRELSLLPNDAPAFFTDEKLHELAESVIHAYAKHGQTIACAESLTAGMVCSTLASVPGSSAVLRGGLVVYATDLKVSLADVPQQIIDVDGAVSATTARALALGVRKRCGADVGISLTGVAGPDEQEGKPAGQVYVGIADQNAAAAALASDYLLGVEVFRGDRAAIRRQATASALVTLVERINKRVTLHSEKIVTTGKEAR